MLNHDQPEYYTEDLYAKDDRIKSADINIQKIKCINENVNVKGIGITEIPQDPMMTKEAQAQQENDVPNGNGLLSGDGINFDKNLVNICVNINVNEQVDESEQKCEGYFTQN